jgi:hypothetical protein
MLCERNLTRKKGRYAMQVVPVGQPEEIQREDGHPFSRIEKH